MQFLLLLTNLAREWLQIDADLLHVITSTADALPGGTNIYGFYVIFFAILGCDAHLEWIFAEIYWR